MDKKKSLLNITTSIISRLLLLIAALVVRRLLINQIGNDINGLNSLYTSIIGFLSVAELGIGSAIIYSMYTPIVNGDYRQVAALYCLYKKLYRIVGIVIFCVGLAVIPFLPMLISDYNKLNVNVSITFILSLISVVLTYLYGAKTSLIEAHKNNYITTTISAFGKLVCFGIQAITIIMFHSFTIYLICQIIGTVLIWIFTEIVVRKLYHSIIVLRETVSNETRLEINRNVKAMFMHRIGTVLVSTVDNVIISAFIGVAILGKYSNYSLIVVVVSGTIALFFSPLTSVIGHLCACGDKRVIKDYFDFFYTINYVLGLVFFLGYFAIIDYVIELCFGPGLEISRSISFIITINEFTQYMRNAGLLFRNASGTFYNDRFKPVAEGVSNLVLSLIFVNVFPENMKVVGVIVATIITTLTICYTIEPYVVFHHVFGKNPRRFYIRNYVYIFVFILSLFLLGFLTRGKKSLVLGIIVNGSISFGLAAGVLSIVAVFDNFLRTELLSFGRKIILIGKRFMKVQSYFDN